jgi:hypothetical protein
MFRHLLTLWLITCTIGYGSVWAFDGHLEELTQHEELSSATDHGEDGDDHSSCDHCCHASAHLTGMWANQPCISIPDSNSIWPHYHKLYFSTQTGPPGHPPQS